MAYYELELEFPSLVSEFPENAIRRERKVRRITVYSKLWTIWHRRDALKFDPRVTQHARTRRRDVDGRLGDLEYPDIATRTVYASYARNVDKHHFIK